MNHDDILSLVELGFKLFTDVSSAAHHHHTHQYLNTDNLSVGKDLVNVAQKLYKIGSSAQKSQPSVPVFTSNWRQDNGDVLGFAYRKESNIVAVSYPRLDGSGYNVYTGAGEVYSNSIAIIVSGFNRIGEYFVTQGRSGDGYRLQLITWSPSYETTYNTAIRLDEWSYDLY